MSDILVKNLKKDRYRHRYSYEDISVITGVPLEEVEMWEQGTKKPSMDAIRTLSTIYKVSVEEFMSGEGTKFKYSNFGGIFNSVFLGLLVMTYFLPFTNGNFVSYSGFQFIFQNNISDYYVMRAVYLLSFYVILFSSSIIVLFMSEKAKYLFRYFLLILMIGMMMILYIMIADNMNMYEVTRNVMYVIYVLIMFTTLIDIVMHRDHILSEERQALIRKYMFYFVYLFVIFITVIIIRQIIKYSISDYSEWALVVLLVVFHALSVVTLIKKKFDYHFINMLFSVLFGGTLIVIVLILIEYGIDDMSVPFLFSMALFSAMPLFMVNIDYFSNKVKDVLIEKGEINE